MMYVCMYACMHICKHICMTGPYIYICPSRWPCLPTAYVARAVSGYRGRMGARKARVRSVLGSNQAVGIQVDTRMSASMKFRRSIGCDCTGRRNDKAGDGDVHASLPRRTE